MKKNLLVINTTVKNKIFVALTRGDKFCKKEISIANSDKLLLLIDRVLKKEKVGLKKLGGIIVVSGPGSFTAVRQGVVAGNALGFFLKIPVVGVRGNEFKNDDDLLKIGYEKIRKTKVGEIVLPLYGGEPNITMPKPKL